LIGTSPSAKYVIGHYVVCNVTNLTSGVRRLNKRVFVG